MLFLLIYRITSGTSSYKTEPAEFDDLAQSQRPVTTDPIDAGPFIPSVMAKKPGVDLVFCDRLKTGPG